MIEQNIVEYTLRAKRAKFFLISPHLVATRKCVAPVPVERPKYFLQFFGVRPTDKLT